MQQQITMSIINITAIPAAPAPAIISIPMLLSSKNAYHLHTGHTYLSSSHIRITNKSTKSQA